MYIFFNKKNTCFVTYFREYVLKIISLLHRTCNVFESNSVFCIETLFPGTFCSTFCLHLRLLLFLG